MALPATWSAAKVAVVAAVAAVAVAAGGTVTVAALATRREAPAGGPATGVVTWNMCMDLLYWCQRVGQTGQKVDRLLDLVRREKPAVLLLQEMCASARKPLEEGLAALNDDWTVHFQPSRAADGSVKVCASKPTASDLLGHPLEFTGTPEEERGEYGIMVAVRGRVSSVHRQPLPSAEDREQRVALCVRLAEPRLQVCDAHLSSKGHDPQRGDRPAPFRAEQVLTLSRLLRAGHAAGYHTVTGGDLNLLPDAPALRPLGEADSTECARGKDPTKLRTSGEGKIDHIFVGAGLTVRACSVPEQTAGYSDHRPLLGRFTVSGAPPAVRVDVLPRAHAHNDQAHCPLADGDMCRDNPRTTQAGVPLHDALDLGFTSVEVDVFPRLHPLDPAAPVQLAVGHDGADPWGRTLPEYYLRPLADRVAANGGRVFAGSPATVTLVLDVKNGDPATTVRLLHEALLPYREMLYRWDPAGPGRLVPGAVRVVLTGDRVDRGYRPDGERLMFLDGLPPNLAGVHDRSRQDDRWLPPQELAVVTMSLSEATGWSGDGDPTAAQYDDLVALTNEVHESGRQVRIWGYEGMPEERRKNVWRTLVDADVDFVGADHYAALARVLGRGGHGVVLESTGGAVTTADHRIGADGNLEVFGELTTPHVCVVLTVTVVDWGGHDVRRGDHRACAGDSGSRWQVTAGVGNLHHARIELTDPTWPYPFLRRLALGRTPPWPYLLARNGQVATATDGDRVELRQAGTDLTSRPSVAAVDRAAQWIPYTAGWAAYQLVNRRDGRCLAASGGPVVSEVGMAACDRDDRSQQWWFDGEGLLRNHASGACLATGPDARVGARACPSTMHEERPGWSMVKMNR